MTQPMDSGAFRTSDAPHDPRILPPGGVIRSRTPQEAGVLAPGGPSVSAGQWRPEDSAVDGLRHYLRSELSTRLSEQVRLDGQAGQPQSTGEERRAQAQSILRDAAE